MAHPRRAADRPGAPPAGRAPVARRRAGTVALALVLALVLGGALVGCGGTEARTALAVEHATAVDGGIEITTECARDLEADVGVDHGGSDLLEVTVWGTPRIGRCRSRLRIALPRTPARVVDGATSMVVAVAPQT